MDQEIKHYTQLIKNYIDKNYRQCFREPDGLLKYKFIVPGSTYANELWDWDSYFTGFALHKIKAAGDISEYEKGCVLNFLEHTDDTGRMPIFVNPRRTALTAFGDGDKNIHKPCLCLHALFISESEGSAEWLRVHYPKIEKYLAWYDAHTLHESGLYIWLDDFAIGFDNDPCTFFRPKKSSASIYLNCFMYKELCAAAQLSEMLGYKNKSELYTQKASKLREAIIEHCYDERDEFFYNADTALLPINPEQKLHSGYPRHWSTLIQRIDTWSCFLPMWAGIATKEQAEGMVKRLRDERTFNAKFGVRTLGKAEKMYLIKRTSNPSCWLGPLWGISNYLVFDGLRRYGYDKDARELAEKTVRLFGRSVEENGAFYEYYHPDTGDGVSKLGFQSWNFLVVDMIEYLEGTC